MKTQFDIPALSTVYSGSKNYKIVAGNNNAPNRCFIFFSSNGIYFPNTEAEFHRSIILGDRYEWEKLSPPKSEYRKAIYVRDVRKTWYIDGISEQLNCIESVHSMLKEETRDFTEIVCVGNSAGGYAAVIFGVLLGADKIFSIAGFFEIASQINDPTNLALQLASTDSGKSKWFDLSNLLSENNSAIYFLFAANSELDKSQAQIVDDVSSIRVFPFNDDVHGVCAHNFVYPILLLKSKDYLDGLSNRISRKNWDKIEFSVAVIGLRKTFFCLWGYFSKKIFKSLSKRLTLNS
jgi:hypothetical protein